MAPKKKRSQDVAVTLTLGEDRAFKVYNSAEPFFEQLRIGKVRSLTKSDLAYLAKSDLEMLRRSHERPAQRFNTLAKFLDLILEPDKAESTIGNLAELYARRLRADPSHAQRWLVAQVVWIVFGRAMDVFRRLMRARAGR